MSPKLLEVMRFLFNRGVYTSLAVHPTGITVALHDIPVGTTKKAVGQAFTITEFDKAADWLAETAKTELGIEVLVEL